MFNPQRLVTDAFVDHLVGRFRQAFPGNHSQLEGVLTLACQTSLENLSNCDAAYHDINHTILVTDVGQCILWGRISSQGDLTPEDCCLLYTSPSPRDATLSRMPSSA